jgi:hypothetical protein
LRYLFLQGSHLNKRSFDGVEAMIVPLLEKAFLELAADFGKMNYCTS